MSTENEAAPRQLHLVETPASASQAQEKPQSRPNKRGQIANVRLTPKGANSWQVLHIERRVDFHGAPLWRFEVRTYEATPGKERFRSSDPGLLDLHEQAVPAVIGCLLAACKKVGLDVSALSPRQSPVSETPRIRAPQLGPRRAALCARAADLRASGHGRPAIVADLVAAGCSRSEAYKVAREVLGSGRP